MDAGGRATQEAKAEKRRAPSRKAGPRIGCVFFLVTFSLLTQRKSDSCWPQAIRNLRGAQINEGGKGQSPKQLRASANNEGVLESSPKTRLKLNLLDPSYIRLNMEAVATPIKMVKPSAAEDRSEDSQWIEAAIAGDTNAFSALYRKHLGRVHALCWRLCGGNESLAQEMTQDAFVRAWQKLRLFRGDSAFATWLHRLTVNVV